LDSTLPEIDADPELLHRVFANLVLNAMDAMPQGGTLSLRTLQQGDRIRIEVSDSGVGLTPEESARLFTPYYTTKQHGTGLGLAIAQSVISDHHGTITVESVQGHGAKFVIELPLRAVNPVAASTAAPTIS
jgi:signal transduction histidine kinase